MVTNKTPATATILDVASGRVLATLPTGQGPHEVVLSAETPVVEKDVVAKERVRLDKDTVTEQVEVSESVQKEQIETDGATDVDTDRDRDRR